MVNFRGKKSAKLSDKIGSAVVSPPAPDLPGSLWLSKSGVETYLSLVCSAELEIFIFLLEGSPERKYRQIRNYNYIDTGNRLLY